MISNYGNILSIPKNKMISPYTDKDGYKRVTLRASNGKTIFIGIHKLVAWEFLNNHNGLISNDYIVNHLDCNPANNYIKNLEIVTHSDNCKYGFNVGNKKARKGDDSNFVKIGESTVRKACEMRVNNALYYEISKQLGIRYNYLLRILLSKYPDWNHVTCEYNLPDGKFESYKKDEELRNSIRKLLIQGYKPKKVCEILGLEYTKKNEKMINNARRKIRQGKFNDY